MQLTSRQADYLLYALDAYCKTDARGNVTINPRRNNSASNLKWVQDMRDQLMATHDHGPSYPKE